MSKSLEQKMGDKIKSLITELEEQKIVATEQKLIDELKKTKEYTKTPYNLLRRNVNTILEQTELQKKQKKKSLNNSLPYVKNAKSNSKINSRSHFEDDDEINKEINEEMRKKMKGDDQNNLDIDSMVGLEQLGGLQNIIKNVKEHIYLPLQNQQYFQALNVTPPKGLLLTGPAGSGKTALGLGICKDIYLKYGVNFYFKPSTELISGISGDSEKNLRKLFKDATLNSPSVIFIDEIDAIAGSRDKASKEMERRIVSELLSSLDQLPSNVFVIAATSRPESLEQAIRRGGRFDNEIVLNVPGDDQRWDILEKLTQKNPIHKDVDLKEIAKNTPGYVPADLSALVRKAGVLAVQRIIQENKIDAFNKKQQKIQQYTDVISEQQKEENQENMEKEQQVQNGEQQIQIENNENKLENNENGNMEIEQNQGQNKKQQSNIVNNIVCEITSHDFEIAMTQVQPTGKREGFTSIPEVSWDDIGGLTVLKTELYNNIILPITSPERFEKFNINSPAGVLLYGPPGCGKTLLAKAVANASRANFIAVKGPELLNKYVGESEKSVRSLFSRAKASSPCIIFFDELDALCPKRGTDGNQVTERVVNSLLAELDGVEARKQVYVIAATNRPDIIDPAMLRGGRLDKLFYVPLPDEEDKLQILTALMRKMPQAKNLDLKFISHSQNSKNYSGADLGSVVKETGLLAILNGREEITQEELVESFNKSQPSLSESDRRSYEKLQKNLRQRRKIIEPTVVDDQPQPETKKDE